MSMDDVDVLLRAAVEIAFLQAAKDDTVFATELAAFAALLPEGGE